MLPCRVAAARHAASHSRTPKAEPPLSDTPTPAAPADARHGHLRRGGRLPPPRRSPPTTSAGSFADAIDGTMVDVEDGQIVNGTVVKVDKDEVLLDIGYKSEGVIPSRELSIRNDVDPSEVVSLGDEVEALVLTKEDKEGRLVLSKKRAQYERAWGTIEKIKEDDGVVEGPVIEVVKGGLIVDIGLRGFLPASLVELRRVRDLQPYVGRVAPGQDHRARQEPQQRRAVPPCLPRGDAEGAARGLPRQPQAGRGPQGRRVVGRQLRRLRRPRRHGRPHPRLRAVVEARRPPGLGRRRRRRGHGAGARRRPRPRAHQPVAQGHPAGSVAGVRLHATGRRAGLRPGHQARAVRCLRPGRRRHRGPGAHLGDVGAPRRLARAGRHARRGAVGQDHRPRPRPPPHQPVDQAGRRGRRAWPRSTASTSASSSTSRATTSASTDDAEREAAWAEYYAQYPDGEGGEGPPPAEEPAEAPAEQG